VQLFGEGTVGWQGDLGLVEQEEEVVPGADRLLEVDEALGEACGGFGGFTADLSDVTAGFAGFADGVEVVVVGGVEAAEGRAEGGFGGLSEASAGEVELCGRCEDGFEFVEHAEDLASVLLEALLELLLPVLSGGVQIFCEDGCVADGFVGGEQLAVDVQIANCAGGTANSAEGAAESPGPLGQGRQVGGVDEELERGFEAAHRGSEVMNGFGGGLVEALGHCGLEHDGETEKRSYRLRHEVPTFLDADLAGWESDLRHRRGWIVARNRVGEGGFHLV
jgi:hypothetical protein